MFTHFRSTNLLMVAGLLCASSGLSFAADNRPIDLGVPILTPDNPDSIATIVYGEEEFDVRVVTLSEASVASLLSPDGRDPVAPVRIAKTILSPSGARLPVNIVEIGVRAADYFGRRGSRSSVQWVVNTDLPFTAQAEIQLAIEGGSVVRPRSISNARVPQDVCYLTGVPIAVLYVWFDPAADRQVPPNYGIQIVIPDGQSGFDTSSASDGGDGLGSDGDDGGDSGDGDGDGEGADPIGSPDREPRGD